MTGTVLKIYMNENLLNRRCKTREKILKITDKRINEKENNVLFQGKLYNFVVLKSLGLMEASLVKRRCCYRPIILLLSFKISKLRQKRSPLA